MISSSVNVLAHLGHASLSVSITSPGYKESSRLSPSSICVTIEGVVRRFFFFVRDDGEEDETTFLLLRGFLNNFLLLENDDMAFLILSLFFFVESGEVSSDIDECSLPSVFLRPISGIEAPVTDEAASDALLSRYIARADGSFSFPPENAVIRLV
jgi:hypothetical protein